MLFLNRREVEDLLDLDRLVDELAHAMADLSAGRVSMPARNITEVREHGGLLAAMPVYLGPRQVLSTKLVSVFPRNADRGLPSHQALVMVFDAETGTPCAVMDGTSITAIRTAAGSALATRLLARPDAEVLVIFGTGVQAHTHARAIPRVRPIREIRVVSRTAQKGAAFAREIEREMGIRARSYEPGAKAFVGAHVIAAATHSAEPVVRGAWLEPGMHVNSVGLNAAGCEVDAEAVRKSLVFVESRQAALAPAPSGANDLRWAIRDRVISENHIRAEVGELVAGTAAGRTSPEQITYYRSVGVAVEDAAAAKLVLEAASRRGVGTEVEM
jgi:alanine dehydrogenase